MTIKVTRVVTTEELRRDDLVMNCDQNSRLLGLTVVSKKFGRSRYTVKFSDGVERAFYSADMFTVEREEATPEEIAESARRDKVRILRAEIANLRQRTTRGILEKALDDENDCYLDWSRLGQLMEDQEFARHGEYLATTYERYAEYVDDELTALLAAFAGLLSIRDNRRRRNPISRSTNQISNLMEDMQDFVLTEIIEKVTRWREISEAEMIEARKVCNEAFRVAQAA